MGPEQILQTAILVIHTFGSRTRNEAETMAYLEACQITEILLRDFRKAWEENNVKEPEA
jgi:hypothetical protein